MPMTNAFPIRVAWSIGRSGTPPVLRHNLASSYLWRRAEETQQDQLIDVQILFMEEAMSGIAHKQTMHEGDSNAVMARPAIFGHELGSVRDRTEALLDGFDYETTFLESHSVNDLSLGATLDGLAANDEDALSQNEQLMRLRSELQAERRTNEELKA